MFVAVKDGEKGDEFIKMWKIYIIFLRHIYIQAFLEVMASQKDS